MIDLWTTAWGKKAKVYTELMLPSLLQPGNIPAMKGIIHTYTFYASDEARDVITGSELYKKLEKLVPITWLPLQKGEWEITSNTLHQMRRSAADGHYMMVCSPEDVIGNGSLYNLTSMMDMGYNPILYHLPRTRDSSYPKMVARLKRKPISNAELVFFTLKHIYTLVSHYPIVSEEGGKLFSVWHPTPTPIIKPDEDLVTLFATNWGKNWGYDNCLPYIMIERGYPWKMVPHSDIYFHIEVGGWQHFGPSGKPMNSPCCTWQMAKSNAAVAFFNPVHYPNEHLRTLWKPVKPIKPKSKK